MRFNLYFFVIYTLIVEYELFLDTRSKTVDQSHVLRAYEMWERIKCVDANVEDDQTLCMLTLACCVQIIAKAYTSNRLFALDWVNSMIQYNMIQGDPDALAKSMQQREIAILVMLNGKIFPNCMMVTRSDMVLSSCINEVWWSTSFRELWEFETCCDASLYDGPFQKNVDYELERHLKV